jgi:hypothetical protein
VQQLLEVRVGKDQIKAKQIQIEFIQVEHLPGSSESTTRKLHQRWLTEPTAQVVASPIGSPINVWTASNGSEWDYATNVGKLKPSLAHAHLSTVVRQITG